MMRIMRQTAAHLSSPWALAAFLLVLCAAAYAPLLTRLGFYWDDFPITWIAATMGGEGLERYFATNRPVWGLLYRITTPLLGSNPLVWQVFGLLTRWATGLALWTLLRLIWPSCGHSSTSRAQFAAWAAALFVVYPGFSQHFGAFMYSHFYIVLLAFLLSLIFMLLAIRLPDYRRGWYLPLTSFSLLLGLFNLLAMEYFFLLDLLRPLLIWIALSERQMPWRSKLKHTLLNWLPYLVVFAGAMFWRSVLFGFHTYQPALLSRLRANPLAALGELLPVVFADLWKVTAGAWAKAFVYPDAQAIGARYMSRYWLLTFAGAAASLLFWFFYRPHVRSNPVKDGTETPISPSNGRSEWIAHHEWAWQPVIVGLAALLIGGGPFWLTDLPIGLVFSTDRFTLAFMIGTSLIAAGLLTLLRFSILKWVVPALLAVSLGFAVGLQFQNAIEYNREWSLQRSMFWQMVWRMPYLKPGTALLTNELPMLRYTDNSLTAPLNWIYETSDDPLKMDYALMYPTLRRAVMQPNLKAGGAFTIDYLAATFYGSTDQLVMLYYTPPGCLRVLDPKIDVLNWTVPGHLRDSLSSTTTAPILAEPPEGQPLPQPPAHVFGAEIAHGWCYYFQKADLARQMGDWQTVADLGDQAFAIGDYPNDPVERFPFIEGYAHTGRFERALELTRESLAVSPDIMQPMLCRLWQRIDSQAAEEPEKVSAAKQAMDEMSCTSTQ